MKDIKAGEVRLYAEIKAEREISVDVVKCQKIRLTGADGAVVGTIGLRYADNQLVLSFQGINLRDGDVYLPDLSHVYVMRGGDSVTLASLLGL